MDGWLDTMIRWFALPEHGLSTLFIVAFLSATLLPLGSEPALFGFVKLNPEQYWIAIAVATAGNTLGGMLNYGLGRGAHRAVAHHHHGRFAPWFHAHGARVMFLSFLPVIGDPLCAIGGWMKTPFWPSLGWMAAGKLLRYVVMTAALLWVPESVWGSIGNWFRQVF